MNTVSYRRMGRNTMVRVFQRTPVHKDTCCQADCEPSENTQISNQEEAFPTTLAISQILVWSKSVVMGRLMSKRLDIEYCT